MIPLKSSREIQIMREAAEILKRALAEVEAALSVGVTTARLDQIAETVIAGGGGEPAFKGYNNFPNAACISVNEEVVHGIPGPRKLKDGDIVSFDIGVKRKGYFADAARTWGIGEVRPEKRKLIDTARGALKTALASYRPGNRIGDLSAGIQKFVEVHGFQVVRNYVGHGIGRAIHEDPQVPNHGRAGQGPKIEPGLSLAIEPMVTEGHYEVEITNNGWTVVTKDRKWASHYEDTIVFIEDGFMNLTGDLSR